MQLPKLDKLVRIARVGVAAALAALPAILWSPSMGATAAYAMSLAAILVLGNSLRISALGAGNPERAVNASLGCMLLIPILAARFFYVRSAIFDADHTTSHALFVHLPAIAQDTPRAIAPLLLGVGVSLFVVAGRQAAPLAMTALGAAAGAIWGDKLLDGVTAAIQDHNYTVAAELSRRVGWVGGTAAVGALLGVAVGGRTSTSPEDRRTRSMTWGLIVVGAMAAGWSATSPWDILLARSRAPMTSVAVPVTQPGLPTAQRPIDPTLADLDAKLNALDLPVVYGHGWPCMPDAFRSRWAYGAYPRATVTLTIASEVQVVTLDEMFGTLRKHGVYRIALVGQAPVTPGRLGQRLAWPTIQVLIDRPPQSVQWLQVNPDAVETLELLPGRTIANVCAVVPSDDLTVGELFPVLRRLVEEESACRRAIVLVIRQATRGTHEHPGWLGCRS